MSGRQTIVIASPLEAEHVAALREVAPDRLEVLHEPGLLPPVRYTADHKGAPFTRDAAQERAWRALLARADILWDFPPAELLDGMPGLRWIQATSTGVGPLAAKLRLAERGVTVTTARGVHAGPLAEWVFMALLQHVRGLEHLRREQEARRWIRYCGEDLAGRTLLLIGGGDLARGCARIGKALDMRVVALVRRPGQERSHAALFDQIAPVSGLLDLLPAADAVVVTVPHTPETEGLFGASAFAAMRPGAAFVNIGRGAVVDHAALRAALGNGQVGFAALDVTEPEPLPPEDPLWAMPNVLISPHSASTVSRENARIAAIFRENLLCWLDGRLAEMRNVLAPGQLY
ncbi:D-2-hydroxyacid dehydrogenase [Roseomonas marmotae]|uniref:D-2-hydroxyacid dehydrogenase n=1 Tax=Roseomonas marmotae TaxID=2768161 RepID=A0ABS3KI85_9PROT|nr:D-2-hydroxyacid dehydrogenase [Roseomonas marmotae]MBO1077164.1 D-2-hydroxyacid dehydrogenase [Roseomonas marmotae]QTI81099.1 D-2-hydroxyacid dehydrogenase [Roseomonas marmotae]